MDDDALRNLLASAKTIAVVGLSECPSRPSHSVARYLVEVGYEAIPVNPAAREILGRRSYTSLLEVPVRIDVVDIFLRPALVPATVAEAIEIGARAVWMQIGVGSDEAVAMARAAGVPAVSDTCIMVEHRRLLGALTQRYEVES